MLKSFFSYLPTKENKNFTLLQFDEELYLHNSAIYEAGTELFLTLNQCSSPLLKNALLLQMHYYFCEINEMH